jgi:Kef-type K+ transport system membrane component KefB
VSFATLALIAAVAVLGPVLALRRSWRLPVVLGELAGGLALGPTGFGLLEVHDATFTFLADIGFALVMFVAGSHVPVGDRLRAALRTGGLRAAGVGVLSAALGVLLAMAFGTGHAALYGVLLASSSAALILPIVDSVHLGGTAVLQMLPQVAIADVACIVALPLVVDTHRTGPAALGALAVLAAATVLFVILRYLQYSGLRRRAHRMSADRKFALELRVNLVILFALAALATATHVSIMLAGFSFGLAVAAVGQPRRLARQLFAVTDGFFAPLFFVWLGASLDLRKLGRHPSMIGLGLALGTGAVLTQRRG